MTNRRLQRRECYRRGAIGIRWFNPSPLVCHWAVLGSLGPAVIKLSLGLAIATMALRMTATRLMLAKKRLV